MTWEIVLFYWLGWILCVLFLASIAIALMVYIVYQIPSLMRITYIFILKRHTIKHILDNPFKDKNGKRYKIVEVQE